MLKKSIFGIFCVVAGAMSAFSGDSQIVADPSVHGQRPTVVGTAGGLPQVNINTPNNNGLSYNRYQQFDVGRQGAILNNATQHANTQLGGWIDANPNLVGGAASLIVNEVNSPRPSHLGGFVEIAGHRADVVIANPSGINVAGGGFINANRATLTTGVPQIENGVLTGYNVRSGQISIMGDGLDFKDASFADIVARSVHVNAGVWANNLNVVGGENFVSRDGTEVRRLNPDAETGVSIDVGALGGMYANQIRLVGTGRGVGVNSEVRNAGEIVARVGEVVIDADGNLVSSGFISGKQGVSIGVDGNLVQTDGRIQSEGDVIANVGRSVSLGGEVVSLGNVQIGAAQDFANSGVAQAQGDVDVQAKAGRMDNSGKILAGGASSYDSHGDFSNSGTIESTNDLTLTSQTGSFENSASGNILAGGSLDLTIHQDITNGGSIQSAGALSVVSETGSIENSGTMATNDSFTLKSDGDLETSGEIITGKNLTLKAGGDFANTGDLGTSGRTDITAHGSFANAGSIQSNDSVTVLAETGRFANSGKIATNKEVDLTSFAGMSTSGEILAGGNIRAVAGGGFDNTTGTIETDGSLFIQAQDEFFNSGSMKSQGAMDITALDGWFTSSGRLAANDHASFTSKGDMGITGGTTIAGKLLTSTGGAFSHGGTMQVGGTWTATAFTSITNSGTVKVVGDLTPRRKPAVSPPTAFSAPMAPSP